MMQKMCFFALLICCEVLGERALWAMSSIEPNKTFSMNVGEFVRLKTFVTDADLQVSRRGIVDLQYSEQEQVWQVTAIRGGFVVLYEKKKGEGEERRYFIKVNTSEETKEDGRGLPDLPLWICKNKGILCDEDTGQISGRSSSFEWFLKARDFCKQEDSCFFKVSLTDEGRFRWKVKLKAALGSKFEIVINNFDTAQATTYCGDFSIDEKKSWVDHATGGAVSAGNLFISCLEKTQIIKYRVKARVFLIEDNAAKEIGLSSVVAGAARLGGDISLDAHAKLENYIKEHKATVIGEPVFRVNAGKEARISSGGEFQTINIIHNGAVDSRSSEKDVSLGWKQHGLDFTIEPRPSGYHQVHIKFKMLLKNRNAEESDRPSLQTNTFASEFDVKLNDPVILGGVDFSIKGENSSGPFLLDRVPILGPLFRVRSNAEEHSKLYLWFVLAEDTGGMHPGDGFKKFTY